MTQYQKESKVRRERVPLGAQVDMSKYFRCKLPNEEVLLNPHKEVVVDLVSRRNLERLTGFIAQRTLTIGPCAWDPKKKSYVPMSDFNDKKFVTKMSY